MADAIQLYVNVVNSALPYAIAFGLGQLIVDTCLRMMLGGKVVFR